MNEELVGSLRDLGFTEYEAKAYLALLDDSPVSGYRVAQNSGVPRAKVYEVLGGLVRRGAVYANYSDPVHYAPMPPKELVAGRRREMEGAIEAAEKNLESYAERSASREVIWDITGHDEILRRAGEVASRAQKSILAEVWQEDAPEIKAALESAAGRGVEVAVVAYGDPDYPFATVYPHDLVDEVTRGLGARWIVVSSDTREVVAGIVSLGAESRAAWTSHPGLVVPTTELVKHDIYVQEMLDAHRDVLEASFGPGLVNLRDRLKALESLGGLIEKP